ncbi:F-box/WD repeat-containing protein 7 [Condylostylus longicornis]|uniref:F-box/WD repeat-containing protein 7 n=1 Tax=Condylostylus longicornis TaxID=2530218 RepID=UPI00244D9F7C|nr:F-box/WD repeat-containing protein 7 [Condylostylus longicornis]
MAEKCISSSNTTNNADTQVIKAKNYVKKKNRLASLDSKTITPPTIGKTSVKLNSKNFSESSTSTDELLDINSTITYVNQNISSTNFNKVSDKENNSALIITNKKLHKSLSEKSSTIVSKNNIPESIESKLIKTDKLDIDNNKNSDCISSDSNEDLVIPLDCVSELCSEPNDLNSETSNNMGNIIRCHHHDNVIFLETPVIDDNNVCLVDNHNDFDSSIKSSVKPKRLSEEFLSSDDNDDGIIDDLSASSSSTTNITATTTASKTNPTSKKENSVNSLNRVKTLSEKSNDTSIVIQNVLKSNTLKQNNSDNTNDNIQKINSKRVYSMEDESTSSSNIIDVKEESHLILEREDDDDDEVIDGDREDVYEEEIEDDDAPTSSSLCDANSLAGIHDGNENDGVNGINSGTLSSESTVSFYDNDVQSMDAIERRDFEHEQRLTGGILMRSQSLINSDNKLNMEIIKSYHPRHDSKSKKEEISKSNENFKNSTISTNEHVTTPTSSRNCSSRVNKSITKLNLSMTLEGINKKHEKIIEMDSLQKSTLKKLQPSTSRTHHIINIYSSTSVPSSSTSINGCNSTNNQNRLQLAKKVDLCLANSNSNDSLSSDKSYSTSSNHSLPNFSSKKPNHNMFKDNTENNPSNNNKNNFSIVEPVAGTSRGQNGALSSTKSDSVKVEKKGSDNNSIDDLDSEGTSSSSVAITASKNSILTEKCQYYTNESLCKVKSLINAEHENYEMLNSKFKASNYKSVRFNKRINKQSYNEKLSETNSHNSVLPVDILQPANENDEQMDDNNENLQEEISDHNNFDEGIIENDDLLSNEQQHENDFVDDETWVDCEEGSDEEICTCYNNNNNNEEDDLPSKDVDLSSYIQMVSLSEDMFFPENATMPTEFSNSAQHQRKRKHNDSILNNTCTVTNSESPDSAFNEVGSGRKRMALDYTSTPRTSNINNYFSSPSSITTSVTPIVLGSEIRRTPRSIIPTKDNPPPELHDWLAQFQRWSHAERLLALDRLIEHCEPQQVRHMMKVIEPQFQRDFISLLPRELALQVLSYLEPKDLLRAAQTCRSWRYLCDDNLLWKEKCKAAQITTELKPTKNGILTGEALPKRGRAGNMPPISSPWKAAYMRQHIIEMNWRTRPIRDPKILKGHDDHVITCLQFSGNRIVSGSDDNTLKVWSAVTGKCLRTLVGHTGGVWSSQMSGNIIISGSTDRTLKVWDMETGQCIHTLLGHTSTVRCMHLHGKKVVSGSRDATLRVWDIEQGSCLHVLVGHLAAVRCVQYDGKLIVSGAYDYMVKIWHPERQECLHTLQGHTNRVYSLQFDGIHVVSGSLDTSIRVWDAETGNPKHTLMGHQSLTSGMELRQNILVSGNADSTVKVWDITTGQCLQTLSGPNKHQSAVTCLQFNSRFVITSSDDGTVKLWDVKTGEFIRNLVALESGGSGGVVWRIRANDTKLICAVGSRNGTEETKLMVLDFDVEGACVKCS